MTEQTTKQLLKEIAVELSDISDALRHMVTVLSDDDLYHNFCMLCGELLELRKAVENLETTP